MVKSELSMVKLDTVALIYSLTKWSQKKESIITILLHSRDRDGEISVHLSPPSTTTTESKENNSRCET